MWYDIRPPSILSLSTSLSHTGSWEAVWAVWAREKFLVLSCLASYEDVSAVCGERRAAPDAASPASPIPGTPLQWWYAGVKWPALPSPHPAQMQMPRCACGWCVYSASGYIEIMQCCRVCARVYSRYNALLWQSCLVFSVRPTARLSYFYRRFTLCFMRAFVENWINEASARIHYM